MSVSINVDRENGGDAEGWVQLFRENWETR